MSTENLITSILNQEEDSVNSFLDILSQKIEDTLEVRRVELASEIFAEAKGCPECGKSMKDCECEDEEEDDMEEMKEGYKEDKASAPFKGPYRKASTPKKDQYGNVVKNRAGFLAKLGRAKAEKRNMKEEAEQVQEVIGTTTGYSDSGPKVDAATRKAHQMRNVVTKGPRAGKITKKAQGKVKDEIMRRNSHIYKFARFDKKMDDKMSEEAQQVAEKAPPGAKYERMVKDIKKSYSKDGTLTNKEKAIAYATAWKAKNRKGMSEEISDMQKISALGMKGPDRSSTISALRAYRKHGDINKLSPAHRTLVASYAEKTGGLSAVNRSTAMNALKKEKMQ